MAFNASDACAEVLTHKAFNSSTGISKQVESSERTVDTFANTAFLLQICHFVTKKCKYDIFVAKMCKGPRRRPEGPNRVPGGPQARS